MGHMDTFSIMESLVKLVGADEQISNYASAEQLEWLRDTPLMQMLLDRWGPGKHRQGCASRVLWGVAVGAAWQQPHRTAAGACGRACAAGAAGGFRCPQ